MAPTHKYTDICKPNAICAVWNLYENFTEQKHYIYDFERKLTCSPRTIFCHDFARKSHSGLLYIVCLRVLHIKHVYQNHHPHQTQNPNSPKMCACMCQLPSNKHSARKFSGHSPQTPERALSMETSNTTPPSNESTTRNAVDERSNSHTLFVQCATACPLAHCSTIAVL